MSSPHYVPYELQYRNNVIRLLRDGAPCDAERTGTGTRLLTGLSMAVDLAKEFPLLTSKFVPLPKVAREDKWFISGSTSVDDLKAMGVGIWNEWASNNGQLGPLYGAMWRRRPATIIRYKQIGPLGHNPETHRLVTEGVLNNVFNHCDELKMHEYINADVRIRDQAIANIWRGMIGEARFLNTSVYKPWLDVTEFIKDFPRLPGNEYLALSIPKSPMQPAVRVCATNHHMNANHYGPDSVAILPEYMRDTYTSTPVVGTEDEMYVPIFFIDQLAEAVDLVKARSQSRRIVVDSWDPSLLPDESLKPFEQPDLGLQALAPCHCFFQFNVVPGKLGQPDRLDTSVFMR